MSVIHVRVQPRGSRNQVTRREGDVWWIRLTAPPVEGKANAALVEFLSQVLGIARSRVVIEKGQTGRQKTVAVEGLAGAEIGDRLQAALEPKG